MSKARSAGRASTPAGASSSAPSSASAAALRSGPIAPMTRTAPDRVEATASFRTIRDWARYAATRLQNAGVCFGHGTGNAVDEAIWLVCWALDLAVDRYAEFADARIAPSERERVIELVEVHFAGVKVLRPLVLHAPFADQHRHHALHAADPPPLPAQE